MNLKPLIDDPTMDIAEFVDAFVKRFQTDVRSRIENFIA